MTTDITRIQEALREQGIDGWLLYDFHGINPVAGNVIGLPPGKFLTRRWYYLIPAEGEPAGLFHAIESSHFADAPGTRRVYRSWQEIEKGLQGMLEGRRRVAMEYSPECAIPYISRVDAGTVELVRRLGAEVVSSADLVSAFETRWSPEMLASHLEAAELLYRFKDEGFAEVARRLRAEGRTDEYTIQQFLWERFQGAGLTSDSPPIVSVNAHSADPHFIATREDHAPILPGDFLLFDMWARLDRPGTVYADITWTAFAGKQAPDRHREIFDVVRGARDAAIAFVQERQAAGQLPMGWEVDRVARSHIAERGYEREFLHRTGHSINYEVHGNGAHIDDLETRDERRILTRTCFSIEPGVYLAGDFGVRSECDVYVDEEGARATGPLQSEIVTMEV
ncbi:MAG: M24 family metallopeptidase [Acidobacteriota bacterium]|jgi:Xaa-Pro aminopeptidase